LRSLGIDPGLVRTGWAIVEPVGTQALVLAHGLIAPPTAADLPARLAAGASQLREVIAAHQPDFVALEEVFTAPRHPRSALLMAHMRGAICLVLEEAGVPIVALTATTVKQRLTGSGHASKEQVRRMVLRLTSLASTAGMRLDETDAIALALAALHLSGARGQGPGARGQGSGVRGQGSVRAAPSRTTAALRRHIHDLQQR
jgi:crossover junction endodeoxyribonuclease RuvC